MIQKLLAILLFTSISTFAQTEITHYISLHGGAASLAIGDADFDPGIFMELAYGVELDQGAEIFPFRFELAAGFHTADPEDAARTESATLYSLFGNAYLDLLTGTFVRPYGMIGIGGATVDDGYENVSALALQFGLGCGFELSEHWVIDLTAKGYGSIDQKDDKIAVGQILLGARYMF